MKNNEVTLCCMLWNPCCPKLKKESDSSFTIKDDYDSKINLSLEDLKSVIKKIDELTVLPGSGLDT